MQLDLILSLMCTAAPPIYIFGRLAKDGVYLNNYPRSVTMIQLMAGSRADVAVRCMGSGNVNVVSARANLPSAYSAQQTVLTLNVGGGDGVSADLTRFTVNRPCYLSTSPGSYNGNFLRPEYSNSLSEVEFGSTDKFLASARTSLVGLRTGSSYYFTIRGLSVSPFHMQSNHFQISQKFTFVSGDNYFQVNP